MKLVSDVYTSCSGNLMVEWEYLTGGRFREKFATEELREKALEANEQELQKNKKVLEDYTKEQDEWLAEMKKKYGV